MGERSPRGRPRDGHIDALALDAASEILDAGGYRDVAIEEVARRAGVSKTAVYRRWPNRRRLVLSVLEERLGRIAAPDSGCILCDLHECLVLIARAISRLGAGTLAQLTAEGADDPDFRRELLDVVVEPPRREVHRTLHTAMQRGDLREGVDLALTVDVLASLTFYRQLFGDGAMDAAEIEGVVIAILRGIAADYEELARAADLHEVHEHAD